MSMNDGTLAGALGNKRIGDGDDGEPRISVVEETNSRNSILEAIRRTTGLNVQAENLQFETHVEVAPEPAEITPVSVPAGSMIKVPADSAGTDVLGLDEESRLKRMKARENEETASLLDGLLMEEHARLERRDELESNIRDMDVQDEIQTPRARRASMADSTNPELGPDELVPKFDVEYEDMTPSVDDDAEDVSRDNYTASLPVVETPESEERPVTRIREPDVPIVPRKFSGTGAYLANDAFHNAITQLKRQHFGKVTVPLVNSGFLCDITGTGVVDLQNLYLNVSKDVTMYEYQMELMQAIIKNVSGTSPRIPETEVASRIHYEDFQMMAYGHVCATLKKVQSTVTCQFCGRTFRAESYPMDLLLNRKELDKRRKAIEAAHSVEDYSLLSTNKLVRTSVGHEITIGHPSYAEFVRSIRGYMEESAKMSASERKRFEANLNRLYMIQRIKLVNGPISRNIAQHYEALTTISDADLARVDRVINDMQEQIITPKYGIESIECKFCGGINRNVAIDDLVTMVFYHTLVSSELNRAAGNSGNGS